MHKNPETVKTLIRSFAICADTKVRCSLIS